jgi:hypothetical protein
VSKPIDAPKVERIHTFDLLRGYFLIVILLNHLFYYPSGLELLTGRGLLYVSTAEGFFLISGIVLGIVRGQKLRAKPFSLSAKLLLKRSAQLYVTYVFLTLLFTFLAWAFFMGQDGLKSGIADTSTSLMQLVWQTLTFQYLYGWADFLRLYVIFIAAAPLAMWLLRRGWWYVLLALSFGIWTLFPEGGNDKDMPISWQLVFFSGLIIGFHWPQLQARWSAIRPKVRNTIGISLATGAGLTMVLSALLVFHAEMSLPGVKDLFATIHGQIGGYFDKPRLPIARLLLGALWFWGLFWLIRRFEPWVVRRLGWLLTPLGVNSLYVYTIQSFIVFFFHLFVLLPMYYERGTPWYINLTVSLAALALVWFAVQRKFLFRIIPR